MQLVKSPINRIVASSSFSFDRVKKCRKMAMERTGDCGKLGLLRANRERPARTRNISIPPQCPMAIIAMEKKQGQRYSGSRN